MEITRVYVEKTGIRIAPFNDYIGDTPVLNRPLKEWQDMAFRRAGLKTINSLTPPCLVVPDNIFATSSALLSFLKIADGNDAVLVLKKNHFTRATSFIQPGVREIEEGYLYSSIRVVSGNNEKAVNIALDTMEKTIEFPLPSQYTGEQKLVLAFPRHAIVSLHHWVHILWLNQAAYGILLLGQPLWKLGIRVACASIKALSLYKWKILGKFNKIGKRCDIHPTAVIEGSVIGNNVTIGPFARVFFSTVGDYAEIQAGAYVEGSVIGRKALVNQKTVLRLSVLYPEAVAGQYLMQACILGEKSLTTGAGFTIDLNLDHDIKVEFKGKRVTTGTRFLGAAFGHRCCIGTGIWIASGRSIPNDCLLIRDPEQVLSMIPAELDRTTAYIASEKKVRALNAKRKNHEL